MVLGWWDGCAKGSSAGCGGMLVEIVDGIDGCGVVLWVYVCAVRVLALFSMIASSER